MTEINERKKQNSQSNNEAERGIGITLYTDPLCCWSWGMQGTLRKLREQFAGSLDITYKMAGLLPSWKHFEDSVNSLHKPVNMGSEWMHAAEVTRVEINPSIWMSDPPASSFPACIAVKCAEMQSKEAGESYFFLLQEAVMTKGLNIARNEVLLDVARLVAIQLPAFNLFSFREDLLGGAGTDAFKRDWEEVKHKQISRLPTLIIRSADRPAILLAGYQTYETLERVLAGGVDK